jgi:hypothetical protein
LDSAQEAEPVQHFSGIEAGGSYCSAGAERAAAFEGFAGAPEGVCRLEAGDEFLVALVLERHDGVAVCLGQGDAGVGEQGGEAGGAGDAARAAECGVGDGDVEDAGGVCP